jgi:predicted nucleic acid-binding protein
LSTYVLDASVAAKWLLPSKSESLHAEALTWLTRYAGGELVLVVPDLFWIEVANVMWRAVRHARVTKSQAKTAMAGLRERDFETISTAGLIETAFEMAVAYQRTVYDSLYIALARERGIFLVTADEKLANAVAAHLPVKWLGSF